MKKIKNILSFVMAIVMMASMVVVPIYAADPADAWDGTADISWYTDGPTEFTLTTAEQLAGLAELVNGGNTFSGKTIKLGADMQLNDTADFANWSTTAPANVWTAIGAYNIGSFQGTFDGQGHTISGMYATNDSDLTGGKRVGLFGYTLGKVYIENLTMEKCFTKADTCAAILVGFASNDVPSFANVTTVDCAVTGGGDGTGILVGKTGGYSVIDIENCSIAGTLTGKTYVGGFIGYIVGGTNKNINVINCAADITVSATNANSYSGGLFGTIGRGTASTFTDLNVVNNDGVARTIKVNITGGRDFGGLVGYLNCASIGDLTFDGITVDVIADSTSFATSTNYQGIAALIGYINSGATSSITVKDTTITGELYVGQNCGVAVGRAAKAIGSVNIVNVACDVDFFMKKGAGNTQCIGFIGLAQGEIGEMIVDGYTSTNTYTVTDTNGAANIGDLLGSGKATTVYVSDANVDVTMTGVSSSVGVLLGSVTATTITVADSDIKAAIAANGSKIGGIASNLKVNTTFNMNGTAVDVTLKGTENVGGLFGQSVGNLAVTITDSEIKANVEGANAGGFAGYIEFEGANINFTNVDFIVESTDKSLVGSTSAKAYVEGVTVTSNASEYGIELIEKVDPYVYDGNGTLTINYLGDMPNFMAGEDKPWSEFASEIKTVIISDSVTSIGDYAFRDLTALTNVVIGANVGSIGTMAFRGCTSLENIVIPENVSLINAGAFYGCSSLKSVTIENRDVTFSTMIFSSVDSDFTIYGHYASTAEVYAAENGHKFVSIDEEEIIASGTHGENLTWTLTNFGTLTISGEGPMAKITSSTSSPWYKYRANINKVIIEEGVTSIATYAFHNANNLNSVLLPDSLTTIESNALLYTSIESIDISANVTSIGNLAFQNCNKLKEINVDDANEYYVDVDGILFSKDMAILCCYPSAKEGVAYIVPDTVTTIMPQGFARTQLEIINIPASVYEISASSFYQNENLLKIDVDSDNNSYSDFDGVLFSKDMTTLVYMPVGFANVNPVYTVPSTVTTIAPQAFVFCKSLSAVHLHEDLTAINQSAFRECVSLTSVVIPDSITVIAPSVFYGCLKLESIVIPNSITNINSSAFANCYRLDKIYFTGTEEEWNAITKATGWDRYAGRDTADGTYEVVFGYDAAVEILYSGTYGENLTWTIDSNGTLTISGEGTMAKIASSTGAPWYKYRADIKKAVIEEGITNIAANAFYNTVSLKTVEIPDSVTRIEWNSFMSSAIESVYIPANVRNIDTLSFQNCRNLKEIKVDEANANYTDVDGILFSKDMTVLHYYPAQKEGTVYSIPDTVVSVMKQAFRQSKIEYLYIPASVRDLDGGAFEQSECLFTIEVDDESEYFVTLDGVLFSKDMTRLVCMPSKFASTLTSYSVPDGVKKIDNCAFMYCSTLTSIDLPNTLVEIGTYAFSGCKGLVKVVLPYSLETIGRSAFQTCSSLTSIVISRSIKEIQSIFDNCFLLDNIYFTGTEAEWNAITKVANWDRNVGKNTADGTYEIEFEYAIGMGPIFGDANGDGVVDGKDLVRLKRYIAEYDYSTGVSSIEISDNADANGDGVVDGKDLVRLKRYIADYDYSTGTSGVVLGPQ